MSTRV